MRDRLTRKVSRRAVDGGARQASVRPVPGAGSAKPMTEKGKTAKASDRTIVVELGARIKRMRLAAGLTLEALCAQSGVSRAMLSKVERGEKSPTLTVMVRIAKGLDVSLSMLMGAEPQAAASATVRAAQRLIFRDPDTGFERHVLSPSNIDSDVELLMHRIPPGQSSGVLPAYDVPAEKFIVVQEGHLTVLIGERRYDLTSGDSFHFKVREPYRFDNHGNSPCVYYLIIARQAAH